MTRIEVKQQLDAFLDELPGDNIQELEARIQAEYPWRPVLYIESEAEQFPALVIRSPRLLMGKE